MPGAAGSKAQWFRFDVGVEPLFDQRLDLTGRGIGDADIQAVLIAAQSAEIELAGGIAEPLRGHGTPRIALDVVGLRHGRNRERLITSTRSVSSWMRLSDRVAVTTTVSSISIGF
jgi:hypothetical protein